MSAKVVTVDVAVVGAGISGLIAARDLIRGGITNVVVIDGRDRVGGRTHSRKVGKAFVDLGGQWIGPGQTRMLELTKELGIELHEQYATGRKILDFDGQISSYNSDIPSMGIFNLIDVHFMLRKVEEVARTVPKDNPMNAPNAKDLDSMSVETFLNQCWTDGAKLLCRAAVQAIFGAEPRDISALYFLWYISSSGSFESLITIRNGHQQWTMKGGAQQVSERLAAEIGASRVMLGAEVASVRVGAEGDACGAVLGLRDGTSVHAARVIFATSHTILGRMQRGPGVFSVGKEQLQQRQFMGSIIKTLAIYERPYWREKGFSGEVVGDASTISGPGFNAFDDSLPIVAADEGVAADGTALQPAIVLFLNGQRARESSEAQTSEERREAVVRQLARWFGPEMLSPVEYVECDWVADAYARGCPVGCWPTGLLAAHAHTLRRPERCFHYAGTETAQAYQGFMEGAVEAGQRAAKEILDLKGDLARVL
eukprot:TRINITY_DN2495_c0_g1_i1.p1 TRINITY_DN2495_c0_g1~~TRINITY_DN2495_c0_g1_i1.p1  ORF type:complete len:483 (+),score=80.38 TRINITY_DN2495_c0_g1_i1:45-1493(+)